MHTYQLSYIVLRNYEGSWCPAVPRSNLEAQILLTLLRQIPAVWFLGRQLCLSLVLASRLPSSRSLPLFRRGSARNPASVPTERVERVGGGDDALSAAIRCRRRRFRRARESQLVRRRPARAIPYRVAVTFHLHLQPLLIGRARRSADVCHPAVHWLAGVGGRRRRRTEIDANGISERAVRIREAFQMRCTIFLWWTCQ